MFDLDKGSTLHIDLAKSNSRSKRSRAGTLFIDFFLLLFGFIPFIFNFEACIFVI